MRPSIAFSLPIATHAGGSTLAALAADRVRKFWSWCVECAARRRQRRELLSLDERLLRDIGITRWEARMEASKPFWAE